MTNHPTPLSAEQLEAVKRYDCTNGRAQHCYGCYQMTERDDGEYVSAEDYDALLAEVRQLRDTVDAINENAANVIDDLHKEINQLRADASVYGVLDKLDEALEALEMYGRHDDQGYRKLKDWYRQTLAALNQGGK